MFLLRWSTYHKKDPPSHVKARSASNWKFKVDELRKIEPERRNTRIIGDILEYIPSYARPEPLAGFKSLEEEFSIVPLHSVVESRITAQEKSVHPDTTSSCLIL